MALPALSSSAVRPIGGKRQIVNHSPRHGNILSEEGPLCSPHSQGHERLADVGRWMARLQDLTVAVQQSEAEGKRLDPSLKLESDELRLKILETLSKHHAEIDAKAAASAAGRKPPDDSMVSLKMATIHEDHSPTFGLRVFPSQKNVGRLTQGVIAPPLEPKDLLGKRIHLEFSDNSRRSKEARRRQANVGDAQGESIFSDKFSLIRTGDTNIDQHMQRRAKIPTPPGRSVMGALVTIDYPEDSPRVSGKPKWTLNTVNKIPTGLERLAAVNTMVRDATSRDKAHSPRIPKSRGWPYEVGAAVKTPR